MFQNSSELLNDSILFGKLRLLFSVEYLSNVVAEYNFKNTAVSNVFAQHH